MHPDPNMTESLQETRRKYLRWSIPSIVLAIITVLFAVASFWAQMHVGRRYESIVSDYLKSNAESDPRWTLDSMRHASIAAKRLVVENPESAEVATRFALVEFHSQRELMRTLSNANAAIDKESRQQMQELAKTMRQRAIDSMRRAAKLEGLAAGQARLWMLDWQFREDQLGTAPSGTQLEEWYDACKGMIASGDDAQLLLADLLIHRAYFAESDVDSKSTSRWLQEAVEHLSSITNPSIERDASWIEATAISDPLKAKNEAVKAISNQRHLHRNSVATWREREAMFRIRLGLGNPQEAFDFAWARLGEIAPPERDLFRRSTASSALRFMKAQLLGSSPQSDKNAALLFGFAIRMAPDSARVTPLLKSYLLNDSGQAPDALSKAIEQGPDTPLKDLLDWLRQCRNGSDGGAIPPPPASLAYDQLLAPGTILTIILLKRSDVFNDQDMLNILNRLVPIWNDYIELHSLRSELAVQLEEYPSAYESLVKLRERFPEEPRIISLLKRIESKIKPFEGDSPALKPESP